MKKDNISTLAVIPEEHDIERLEGIDFSLVHSEMTETERMFINGLIRYYEPKNILELGVSSGGGTVVLLNAISDIPDSTLVSIDRLEKYYRDENVMVGSDVEIYANVLLPNKQKWNLICGKDPSDVMENLGKQFDFVVLDTLHRHPVELLNFLCVLPYLRDGAIVVLHDISLFLIDSKGINLACTILMSAVVGEKLFPQTKSTSYISNEELVNNICAIQISPDTRKYVSNLFLALSIPWEYYPFDDIKSIRRLLSKHYDSSMMQHFEKTAKLFSIWLLMDKTTFSIMQVKKELTSKLSKKTIFYGAGAYMKTLLSLFDVCGIEFHYPIWDIKAEIIKSVNGHIVEAPDFKTRVNGVTAIITVLEQLAADSVRTQLEFIGYTCILCPHELFS